MTSRSYRDNGIVLRTYKLGEADRIIVLFTEAHGKVRAVAKGVRKTRSQFGSRLEPTSHVSIQLYRGRGELETVTQVAARENLSGIREHLDRLTTAAGMLEAVDYLTPDREPNPAVFTMLAGALRTVAVNDSPLVGAAFLWKLLAHEGYHPVLNECVACGSADELVSFDFDDGGVRCMNCRRGRSVSADALDIVRMILGGHMVAALGLPSSAATSEVAALAVNAFEHYAERGLRSARLLGG